MATVSKGQFVWYEDRVLLGRGRVEDRAVPGHGRGLRAPPGGEEVGAAPDAVGGYGSAPVKGTATTCGRTWALLVTVTVPPPGPATPVT